MVIITEHAKLRYKQRCNLGFTIEQLADKALKEGGNLSPRLREKTVKLGYYLHGYWTAVYKVYGGFIWVFQPENDTYILTTIYPMHFLKQRNKRITKNKVCSRCRKSFHLIQSKKLVCNLNGVVFYNHNIV